MSGTNAATAKAALIAALAELPALSELRPSYSMPRNPLRECIYGGPVAGPVTLAGMRGSGRIKREEHLSFPLVIRVNEPGHDTTEATDARAAELSTVVEEYIAATPTLGGGVTGLLKATVDAVELDGWTDDDGATSQLTLTVGLHSYLS